MHDSPSANWVSSPGARDPGWLLQDLLRPRCWPPAWRIDSTRIWSTALDRGRAGILLTASTDATDLHSLGPASVIHGHVINRPLRQDKRSAAGTCSLHFCSLYNHPDLKVSFSEKSQANKETETLCVLFLRKALKAYAFSPFSLSLQLNVFRGTWFQLEIWIFSFIGWLPTPSIVHHLHKLIQSYPTFRPSKGKHVYSIIW